MESFDRMIREPGRAWSKPRGPSMEASMGLIWHDAEIACYCIGAVALLNIGIHWGGRLWK